MRSDWHSYNLRQKLNGLEVVTEAKFEGLLQDLDLSLSGSEQSSSEDDSTGLKARDLAVANLLKRQAQTNDVTVSEYGSSTHGRPTPSSPLLWFSSSLLQPHVSLGVYKALFFKEDMEKNSAVAMLQNAQVRPMGGSAASGSKSAGKTSDRGDPTIFLCMIGGGHFAGMVVSLVPRITKNSGVEERQAQVIVHKTFHRYTTRRKQGGAQSANDSSKGNAHSAGAGIRRYNETALESEVRDLLASWRVLIGDSKLHFIRATGSANRRILFGPYDGQVLRSNDPKIRSFPFSTRRATQSELMRAFLQLTRIKVAENNEPSQQKFRGGTNREAVAVDAHKQNSKAPEPRPSKEDEEAILHTTQLQSLIRRSKGPALVSYLHTHMLSPNFVFRPPDTQAHHHTPTPLHLAASTNSAPIILALLIKSRADPTLLNGEGKVAFEVAGDRATRDAFRIARSELGEDAWDWRKACCPSAMTRAQAEEREQSERTEAQRIEELRRKTEMARLQSMDSTLDDKQRLDTGRRIRTQEVSAEDRREMEGRGLTAEMKLNLERERRARAAEERMKRMNVK